MPDIGHTHAHLPQALEESPDTASRAPVIPAGATVVTFTFADTLTVLASGELASVLLRGLS
ncbi:hypothetical protein DAT35_18360 [Vitiosangium sp. GDMCC 1.1324]|nr:hypothetical protein DAT35_18360 [Vitiosangium sp. GDMCC 1.1324]